MKPATTRPTLTLKNVDCIWDRSAHNAFTDLCHFKGAYWLAFREGDTHVSRDGAITVLASDDGKRWYCVSQLVMDDTDLRDPKITVTPDDRLLITCAGVLQTGQGRAHQSFLFASDDGSNWSGPQPVGALRHWIWRTRFFGADGFGVAYVPAEESSVLYKLSGGEYLPWVDPFFSKRSHGLGYPNEHDLFALDEKYMACLLRRDADTASAQLGIAKAPYKTWQWHDLGVRIGGPVVLPVSQGDGSRVFLTAVRLHNPVRTALCWLDVDNRRLEEVLTLPSGGDTSYAGLLQTGSRILCSYYSSHERKTAIYLAELEL